jgi:hypothetical protein
MSFGGFWTRTGISLANHGRAFGATSARVLRASVADWLIGLADYQVDIRAQNKSVAEHYIQQFPQLSVIGHDWMGHPKLGLTDARAATKDLAMIHDVARERADGD